MRLPPLFFVFAAIAFGCVSHAAAKYPVLSRMARTSDGPYQPEVRRYVTVDPAPAGEHATHGHAADASSQLWVRRDLATPVYPYGWFGARHANERWRRGSYYDDYQDVTILRGR